MLSRNSIARLEMGERNITDRTIADICREFNVHEKWLRSGAGEVFVELDEISLDDYAKNKNATELEKELFKAYLSLSKDLREELLNFVVKFGNDKENSNTFLDF